MKILTKENARDGLQIQLIGHDVISPETLHWGNEQWWWTGQTSGNDYAIDNLGEWEIIEDAPEPTISESPTEDTVIPSDGIVGEPAPVGEQFDIEKLHTLLMEQAEALDMLVDKIQGNSNALSLAEDIRNVLDEIEGVIHVPANSAIVRKIGLVDMLLMIINNLTGSCSTGDLLAILNQNAKLRDNPNARYEVTE